MCAKTEYINCIESSLFRDDDDDDDGQDSFFFLHTAVRRLASVVSVNVQASAE